MPKNTCHGCSSPRRASPAFLKGSLPPAGDEALGDFAPFGGVELLGSIADASLGRGGSDAGRSSRSRIMTRSNSSERADSL
jgi:hypothetical protein